MRSIPNKPNAGLTPVHVPLDVSRINGRIVAPSDDWDGVIQWIDRALAVGVYEVSTTSGTVVAVATVRDDGTWRLEGGKRR